MTLERLSLTGISVIEMKNEGKHFYVQLVQQYKNEIQKKE